MSKRDRNVTEEERKAKKRAKKEAKKEAKREAKEAKRESKKARKDRKRSASAADLTVSSTVKKQSLHKQEAAAPETSSGTIGSSNNKNNGNSNIINDVVENSNVLVNKKVSVTISLLPGALKNVQLHIENAMRQFLMKYSDGMGGVLLAYENVKIVEEKHAKGHGWILNELPYIHFDVTLDAVLFCPRKGAELVGFVNECFASHIGILVYGYFNAMVSAEELRSLGYTFHLDSNRWISHEAPPDGKSIEQDIPVKFVVKEIHECDGMMSLEGTNLSVRLVVEEE